MCLTVSPGTARETPSCVLHKSTRIVTKQCQSHQILATMKSIMLSALMMVAICALISTAKPTEDLDTAASNYGSHGHVQIKVYRGPDSGQGNGDGNTAPFGYWVKQPADDDRNN